MTAQQQAAAKWVAMWIALIGEDEYKRMVAAAAKKERGR